MADRLPVNLQIIFNDGQALFLHSEQIAAFKLEAKGAVLPEGIDSPTKADVVGHLYQLTIGFAIGIDGIDAEAESVNDSLTPYLISYKDIPPLKDDVELPAPSGLKSISEEEVD